VGIVKRIDQLCADAIEDIRKKWAAEFKRHYKYDPTPLPFTQASKILGSKYFMKNFGVLTLEQAQLIITNRRKVRG